MTVDWSHIRGMLQGGGWQSWYHPDMRPGTYVTVRLADDDMIQILGAKESWVHLFPGERFEIGRDLQVKWLGCPADASDMLTAALQVLDLPLVSSDDPRLKDLVLTTRKFAQFNLYLDPSSRRLEIRCIALKNPEETSRAQAAKELMKYLIERAMTEVVRPTPNPFDWDFPEIVSRAFLIFEGIRFVPFGMRVDLVKRYFPLLDSGAIRYWMVKTGLLGKKLPPSNIGERLFCLFIAIYAYQFLNDLPLLDALIKEYINEEPEEAVTEVKEERTLITA